MTGLKKFVTVRRTPWEWLRHVCGVGDDTKAVQRAIDAARAEGGVTVFVPRDVRVCGRLKP